MTVKRRRLELPRHNCHYPLKVARLPIPPPLQNFKVKIFVPRTGLEPACLSTHAPETCASTIPPPGHCFFAQLFSFAGAENETRTRDPNLGKVMLYQLSYFRIFSFAVAKVGIFRNSANILHLFFTRICTLCFRKQTIVLIINSFGPDSLHKKIACIFPLSLLLSTKRWRDDGFR